MNYTKMLQDIKNGVIYQGIYNGYGTGKIYLKGNYIAYEHFGSSAIKPTQKDLKWLCSTIFKDCSCFVPCEYSQYHINYVPIDKAFKGVDLSTRHPNVYGL